MGWAQRSWRAGPVLLHRVIAQAHPRIRYTMRQAARPVALPSGLALHA